MVCVQACQRRGQAVLQVQVRWIIVSSDSLRLIPQLGLRSPLSDLPPAPAGRSRRQDPIDPCGKGPGTIQSCESADYRHPRLLDHIPGRRVVASQLSGRPPQATLPPGNEVTEGLGITQLGPQYQRLIAQPLAFLIVHITLRLSETPARFNRIRIIPSLVMTRPYTAMSRPLACYPSRQTHTLSIYLYCIPIPASQHHPLS